jgi:hypothetical protein
MKFIELNRISKNSLNEKMTTKGRGLKNKKAF